MLLGHAKPGTTAFGTAVAARALRNVTTRFDRPAMTVAEERAPGGRAA